MKCTMQRSTNRGWISDEKEKKKKKVLVESRKEISDRKRDLLVVVEFRGTELPFAIANRDDNECNYV